MQFCHQKASYSLILPHICQQSQRAQNLSLQICTQKFISCLFLYLFFFLQVEDKATIIPLVAGLRKEVQNLVAEVSSFSWQYYWNFFLFTSKYRNILLQLLDFLDLQRQESRPWVFKTYSSLVREKLKKLKIRTTLVLDP